MSQHVVHPATFYILNVPLLNESLVSAYTVRGLQLQVLY